MFTYDFFFRRQKLLFFEIHRQFSGRIRPFLPHILRKYDVFQSKFVLKMNLPLINPTQWVSLFTDSKGRSLYSSIPYPPELKYVSLQQIKIYVPFWYRPWLLQDWGGGGDFPMTLLAEITNTFFEIPQFPEKLFYEPNRDSFKIAFSGSCISKLLPLFSGA